MWASFKDWLAQPFSAEQDAKRWFLFIGFFLCVMILWRIILGHIIAGLRE